MNCTQNHLDLYLRHCETSGLALGTVLWYRRRITKFIGYSEKHWQGILSDDSVSAFLGGLKCTDAGRAGYWRAIRAWSNWMAHPDQGYTGPLKLRPRFKPPPPKVPPSPEYVLDVINQMPRQSRSQRRDYTIINFLYWTGCRAGEALSLRSSQIDLTAGLAVIYGQKTNQYRTVPLVDRLLEVLVGWLGHIPADYPWVFPAFWPQLNNHHVSLTTLEHRWRAHQQAIGAKPINLHMLRHAFGAHNYNRGVQLHDLQAIMGHSHISTTQIYAHLDAAGIRDRLNRRVAASMDRVFG